MHHKVSRRALVALLAAVSLLAIPSAASAHFRGFNYSIPADATGLDCNEAIWYGVSHMGNFHGGVARVGACPLSFASGGNYWEELSFGWRANDGSLMRTWIRKNYCFCQNMGVVQTDAHQ